MKKLYIAPRIISVVLEAENEMLLGSENGDGTYNGGGSKGDYSSGQLSRRGGADWDDEE